MSFNLYQERLEQQIRGLLITIREKCPDSYATLLTLTLFTEVNKTGNVAAAAFNKAVGDLRKVGIVCTGNGTVWLSDGAWEMHKAKQAGGTR